MTSETQDTAEMPESVLCTIQVILCSALLLSWFQVHYICSVF